MKAALTVWDGRISPVFDVSREVLIVTLKNGSVVARSIENIEVPTTVLKLNRLLDHGVETLICGAISEPLHHELEKLGVEVIGFVAGEIDEVVDSFIKGALPSPALSMPGCSETQNRLCGGGGRRRRCGGGRR